MSADPDLTPLERRIAARIAALPDTPSLTSRGRALLLIGRRVDALRAARRRRRAAFAGLGVLLVGGAAAAAPPVRSWIGAHVGSHAAPERVAAPPDPRAIRDARRMGNIVYFTPTGDDVVVRFDAVQRGGTLTVATTPIALDAITTLGAVESDEIVVNPGALHIRNDSASTKSYMLLLAKTMRIVRLRLGSMERVVVVDTSRSQRIPLSR